MSFVTRCAIITISNTNPRLRYTNPLSTSRNLVAVKRGIFVQAFPCIYMYLNTFEGIPRYGLNSQAILYIYGYEVFLGI